MTIARFVHAVALAAMLPAQAIAVECQRTAELAVDADGAPDSYRVDGKGLSYTCDGVFAVVDGVAQHQNNNPKHWQALCNQYWAAAKASQDYRKLKIVGFLKDAAGTPLVQAQEDPLPGLAYVTTTSMTIPGTPANTQRHFVNANEIPYIVASNNYSKSHKLQPGDLVAVFRPKTGRVAFGVIGDCCTLGEASVRLHQDLGSDPIRVQADGTRRAKRGIADPVVFVALPGSLTTPRLDAAAWRAEIATNGAAALAKIGGITAIKACATKLK